MFVVFHESWRRVREGDEGVREANDEVNHILALSKMVEIEGRTHSEMRQTPCRAELTFEELCYCNTLQQVRSSPNESSQLFKLVLAISRDGSPESVGLVAAVGVPTLPK